MKNRNLLRAAASGLLLTLLATPGFEIRAAQFVYETEKELVSTGDFDGDTREDVVIVDKDSGKYRLGYQQASGLFNWVNFRPSGMRYVSALTTGKLIAADRDALAFASADANQLSVWDAKQRERRGTFGAGAVRRPGAEQHSSHRCWRGG